MEMMKINLLLKRCKIPKHIGSWIFTFEKSFSKLSQSSPPSPPPPPKKKKSNERCFFTLKPFFVLKIFKFCPDFFIAVNACFFDKIWCSYGEMDEKRI